MSAPRVPDLSGLALLIVDDHPHALDVIATFLPLSGARVLLARNTAEALRFLEVGRVDVVIADFQRPRISALELLQEIRRHATYGAVPVIAVSSVSEEFEAFMKGKLWRFSAFLLKPVNLGELCATIRNVMGSAG